MMRFTTLSQARFRSSRRATASFISAGVRASDEGDSGPAGAVAATAADPVRIELCAAPFGPLPPASDPSPTTRPSVKLTCCPLLRPLPPLPPLRLLPPVPPPLPPPPNWRTSLASSRFSGLLRPPLPPFMALLLWRSLLLGGLGGAERAVPEPFAKLPFFLPLPPAAVPRAKDERCVTTDARCLASALCSTVAASTFQ